jgi:CBS domain-containing protein
MKATSAPAVTCLADVMTRAVISLHPEDTLRSAMGVLLAHAISGAPVMAEGRVVGVLSATDILDFSASPPPGPGEQEETAWQDWELSIGWEEGDADAPPAYFAELWAARNSAIPNHLEEAMPSWDLLVDHTVSDAMTPRVLSLPPSATLEEAAALMVRTGAHRLLVIEDGVLHGVVSTMDVVRSVAERAI